jgi:hypothetical protein
MPGILNALSQEEALALDTAPDDDEQQPLTPPDVAASPQSWPSPKNSGAQDSTRTANTPRTGRGMSAATILVVTTIDGKQTVVGSWKPAGDKASGLAAATVIPTAQIPSVDIRITGSDAPLAVTTLQ